jgi:hypothetical protein
MRSSGGTRRHLQISRSLALLTGLKFAGNGEFAGSRLVPSHENSRFELVAHRSGDDALTVE